jgi:hypothetical protein
MRFKAHELRDRAESLRRMAREATVEREREALTLQLPFCFEVGSLSGSLVSSAPE